MSAMQRLQEAKMNDLRSRLEYERECLIEELRDDQLDDEERYYLYRDIDEIDRQLSLLEN